MLNGAKHLFFIRLEFLKSLNAGTRCVCPCFVSDFSIQKFTLSKFLLKNPRAGGIVQKIKSPQKFKERKAFKTFHKKKEVTPMKLVKTAMFCLVSSVFTFGGLSTKPLLA